MSVSSSTPAPWKTSVLQDRKPHPRLALSIGLLVVIACAHTEPVQVEASGELSEHLLGSDVMIFEHNPGFAPANVLVVRMPDNTLVLCSSPYDTVTTRLMIQKLRERFQPRRMIAVNVHFHPDGTAGNYAYAAAGVITYGSELTRAELAERGRDVWDITAKASSSPFGARMLATPIQPASKTFRAAEGLQLNFGGEVVEVIYPGPAHSPDNLLVFFPSRRILYGGDLVRAAESEIGYRGDANISSWAKALKVAAALQPEVVVPGHGKTGGKELLDHTRTLIEAAAAEDVAPLGASK